MAGAYYSAVAANEAGAGLDAGDGATRPSGLSHRDLAERLWPVHVDRVPRREPGIRGLATAPVKAVLRPFLRWYVAPLVDAQREFNDVTLKLVDDLHEQLRRAVDERRLEELEERLFRLERVARTAGAPAPQSSLAAPETVVNPGSVDYFTFEARMRGSRADVRDRQRIYLADFQGADPVVDVGCGRGEFLSLLREAGIDAVGVDHDADMIAFCRAEGFAVEQADGLGYLDSVEDGSLGGIFAAQVLEHLQPAQLVRFLELAAAKVRPGGVLVAETMNPLSLVALKHFFADLTHAQPLVPETLVLLARQAGFTTTEVRFLGELPAEERLRPVELPPDPAFDEARIALGANVALLNEVVFGPQDYALVGRR
jgi:SAM-dependent methyltransferase